MTDIKRIPADCAETPLERHVRRWINMEAKEREDGAAGVYKDLQYGGCQSGLVGHLIYYRDTVRFYRRHMREIDRMLQERVSDTGESIGCLFGDNWDSEDPLARDDSNQNCLAWFAFEEAARIVYERAEQAREGRP